MILLFDVFYAVVLMLVGAVLSFVIVGPRLRLWPLREFKSIRRPVTSSRRLATFESDLAAARAFLRLKDLCKRGQFFPSASTRIFFEGPTLSVDSLLTIETSVASFRSYKIYAVSTARVASLTDEPDRFELVAAALHRSVVEGYYRVSASLLRRSTAASSKAIIA